MGKAEDKKRQRFIEQARRTQIVQAAIETIVEVGFAKATFARIAARAEISPALISYHFKSRDQLITQVVADVEASMDAAIVAEAEGASSWAEVIRRLIETQVRYFHAHGDEVLALGAIFANVEPGSEAARHLADSQQRAVEDLESLFREGQDEGELRPFATRPMALSLLASLEAVPAELMSHPDTDVDAYADELATLFVQATSAPSA